MAAVEALLSDGRVHINAQDEHGETALSYARMSGHRQFTDFRDELISYGFSISI